MGGTKSGEYDEIFCVLSLIGQVCSGLLKVGDSGKLTLLRNVAATAVNVADVPNDGTEPSIARKLWDIGRDHVYPARRTVLSFPKYGIDQLRPIAGSKPV